MNTYFDEETHKYYYNGVEVPSVTEIAKPISFERLTNLPSHILENARHRGSLVHEAIETYLLTGEIEWEEIDPIAIPYVEWFVNWHRTYRPKILYVEYRLFDEDYSGTLDLLCEIDGEIYLIDYKATSVIDKKSLSVQLEGYKRKLAKMGIKVDKTAYLHLKKDGYVFKEIETNAEWFDILLLHNKFMREGKTK